MRREPTSFSASAGSPAVSQLPLRLGGAHRRTFVGLFVEVVESLPDGGLVASATRSPCSKSPLSPSERKDKKMARADLSQVPCLNTNYYEVSFRPFSGSFVRFLEQTFSKPDAPSPISGDHNRDSAFIVVSGVTMPPPRLASLGVRRLRFPMEVVWCSEFSFWSC